MVRTATPALASAPQGLLQTPSGSLREVLRAPPAENKENRVERPRLGLGMEQDLQ